MKTIRKFVGRKKDTAESVRKTVKRPSHGKLKLANSCWQTQVGVCERRKNSRLTRSICRQQFVDVFVDCFCAVHTHQLEYANTSLPTLVCLVMAALLQHANYDQQNNNSTNALRPRHFKWCDLSSNFI